MQITQTIKYKNISELSTHPQNPRLIKNDQFKTLCDSIKANHDYFEARPILCNKEGVIFAGNMRYLAAKETGMTEVPVSVMDISEERQREIMIRDNISNGEYNWDLLSNNFTFQELLDWGFNKEELQRGFDLAIDPKEKDDTLPEDVAEVASLGELWTLGRHRMLVGDSTDMDQVSRLMDSHVADMCFCNPPYNINYKGGMSQNKREGIDNDNMSKKDFADFLGKALKCILEHTKGGIYVCMLPKEIETLKREFEEAGGHFQSFIIWVKNNFTLSRSDYQNMYELMLYGWREGVQNHYFINRRDIGNVWEDLKEIKTVFDGEYTTITFQGFKVKLKGKQEGEVIRKKQVTDIWRYDKPIKSDLHPTMKPIALVTEAIVNSSQNGQVVLDTFLGSGSTLIAAEKSDRICYGMELDPKYASVILQRWADYTGLDPVREDGVKWSELKIEKEVKDVVEL